jgi:surfeit locus 1 family protein
MLYGYSSLSASTGMANKASPQWGFYLFMTFAVFVFIALGSWQVYRLDWKADIIGKRQVALTADPIEFQPEKSYDEYTKLILRGKFVSASTIKVPIHRKGKLGCRIYTPFEVSGQTIIILRGWVADPCNTTQLTNELTQIEGWVRFPQPPAWYMADSKSKKGAWQVFDYTALIKDLSINNATPFYLHQTNIQSSELQAVKLKANLPNHHLYYAIFWFSMSIITLLMVIIRNSRIV